MEPSIANSSANPYCPVGASQLLPSPNDRFTAAMLYAPAFRITHCRACSTSEKVPRPLSPKTFKAMMFAPGAMPLTSLLCDAITLARCDPWPVRSLASLSSSAKSYW